MEGTAAVEFESLPLHQQGLVTDQALGMSAEGVGVQHPTGVSSPSG
jgi:hypothetical protein